MADNGPLMGGCGTTDLLALLHVVFQVGNTKVTKYSFRLYLILASFLHYLEHCSLLEQTTNMLLPAVLCLATSNFLSKCIQ
jgi:hypothetical protein